MAGKIFYSMGEVAEMLDVSHSLIRYWEKHFDILKPAKNKKGNRMFSPEDVQNLKTIYHLVKQRGMTLAGAQKYMKASRHQIERDMELAERLATIRSLLAEVRDALGTDGTVMEEVFRSEEVLQTTETIEPVVVELFTSEKNDMELPYPESEDDEPEDIPDFDPEPDFAEDGDEIREDDATPPSVESSKPLYIEQTLF
jgi:DNA-binding transcriptional MerR regulator